MASALMPKPSAQLGRVLRTVDTPDSASIVVDVGAGVVEVDRQKKKEPQAVPFASVDFGCQVVAHQPSVGGCEPVEESLTHLLLHKPWRGLRTVVASVLVVAADAYCEASALVEQ